MNIVLLGSGNVATHLGKAFSNAGHTILQVWSRNFSHAQELADQVKAEAIDKLSQLNLGGDLYIVSVVDDAIQIVGLTGQLRIDPRCRVIGTDCARGTTGREVHELA